MNQAKQYPQIDWTKNEYHQLDLIVKQLRAVLDREDKRNMQDQQLAPGTYNVVDEVIAMLEAEIDYDPTPDEPGEPPMTADEMHTAAWQQHQELHN
jgi:hypothetical protein